MTPLAKKLLIKPGAVVRVFDAPEGYAELLGVALGGTAGDPAPAAADVVQVFVDDAAGLARLVPEAIAAVRRDGILWVTYRKGGAKAGTDLDRDRLHAALDREYGWVGVTLVAVDARWSAMRVRPRALVGT